VHLFLGLERGNGVVEKKVNKKKELSVSNIDFIGLEFADKKSSRGLPPGLAPIEDLFLQYHCTSQSTLYLTLLV
jgi:hypothetical protein